MKKNILAITLATLWITLSEFIRNEFLFKQYWIDHFDSIGLTFETLPSNGILWIVWSGILAYIIFKLLEKFSFKETICITWGAAFVMMWITIYNLQTLPLTLLYIAIPLSLLEIFVAGIIIQNILHKT